MLNRSFFSLFISIMTELIELSNNNANFKNSNGDFSCTFPPKAINKGDQLFLKTSMIDTVVQNPSGQIYLPDDLTLTFSFMFYEYNSGIPETKNYIVPNGAQPAPDTPTFWYYLMMVNAMQPVVKTANVVLKQGVYTPTSLAQEITRLCVSVSSNSSKFVFSLRNEGTHNAAGMVVSNPYFRKIDFGTGIVDIDGTNGYGYHYQFSDNPNPTDIWFGAMQVSLVYNNNNSNRFEFEYLHTPIMIDQQQPVVAGLGSYFAENKGYKFACLDSGILLTDLQPAWFWTSLGFNLNDILVSYDEPSHTVKNFNIYKATTFNLSTVSNLFQEPSRMNNTYQQSLDVQYKKTTLFDSNATNSIKATQFYQADTSPYYLVEIIANFNSSDFQDGSNKSQSISAIVSKAYITNNFITGYSYDSIVYTHNSDVPLIISNARVRILNANTKDVDFNVGPNNYIILNIIRGQSQSPAIPFPLPPHKQG